MIKTTLLNGITTERDKDYTALGLSILEAGVVSGLEVTTNQVSTWVCFIKVTRTATTPSEEILVKLEITTNEVIDTSGTKKVWLEINQNNINDPGLNDANGTTAGSIQTGASYPAGNYIPLASITGGVITDERVFIRLKLLRKWLTADTIIWVDENGEEKYLPFDRVMDNWKTLVINDIEGIVLQSLGVDIVWLIEKSSPVGNDLFIISDSENAGINKKTTINKVFKSYFWYYWDGSDGDVTITTTITLTKDMFYNNLTVNSPGILNTNWFKVFVKGTLSWNGTIRRNWNNWGNWGTPTAWVWGVALNQGSLWLCYAWINWATGVTGVNNWNSTSGITIQDTYNTGNNCKWGNWGSTGFPTSWGGWGQNTINEWVLYNKSPLENSKFISLGFTSNILYNTLWGGVWGWSGWCGSQGTSWGGWGGWSTWGIIFIIANIVTFTWLIESKWGNWGNAGNSTATSNNASTTGWSWGWAGGSWATIFIISNNLNLSWSTINTSWGNWGNWSNWARASWTGFVSWWVGWAGWDWGFVIIEAPIYTSGTIITTGGTGGTGGTGINWTSTIIPAVNGANWLDGSIIII